MLTAIDNGLEQRCAAFVFTTYTTSLTGFLYSIELRFIKTNTNNNSKCNYLFILQFNAINITYLPPSHRYLCNVGKSIIYRVKMWVNTFKVKTLSRWAYEHNIHRRCQLPIHFPTRPHNNRRPIIELFRKLAYIFLGWVDRRIMNEYYFITGRGTYNTSPQKAQQK